MPVSGTGPADIRHRTRTTNTETPLTPAEARRLLPELTAAMLAGHGPKGALGRALGHHHRTAGRYWSLFYRWRDTALIRCRSDARCRASGTARACDRHTFAVAIRECKAAL